MVEAAVALLLGGTLARWVLWPAEMALERRHLARTNRKLAALEADLDRYRRHT